MSDVAPPNFNFVRERKECLVCKHMAAGSANARVCGGFVAEGLSTVCMRLCMANSVVLHADKAPSSCQSRWPTIVDTATISITTTYLKRRQLDSGLSEGEGANVAVLCRFVYNATLAWVRSSNLTGHSI
jgi:hypothetical protein